MLRPTHTYLFVCLIVALLLSGACTRVAPEAEVADAPLQETESADGAQHAAAIVEQDGADDGVSDSPPNAAVYCSAEGRDQLWFWDRQAAQWQLWEMIQLQESVLLPQTILPVPVESDELILVGTSIDEAGATALFIGRWRDGGLLWGAENGATSYTPSLDRFQQNADALYAIDAADPLGLVRLNYDSCAEGACVAERVESVSLANPSGTHELVLDVATGGVALQSDDGDSEPLSAQAYAAQWLNDHQVAYLDARSGDSAGASRLMLKTVGGDAVQLLDSEQGQTVTGDVVQLVDARAAGDAVLVALGDAAQPTTFAVVLVDVQSGQAVPLTDLSAMDWLGVQLAPTGRHAAIGRNNALDLFDLATGEVVASYDTRGEQGQHADFSADGRWLLTLAADGVEVIDLETLEPAGATLPDMEPLGRVCTIGAFLE